MKDFVYITNYAYTQKDVPTLHIRLVPAFLLNFNQAQYVFDGIVCSCDSVYEDSRTKWVIFYQFGAE